MYFVPMAILLAFTGVNANECIELGYDVKQCAQHVAAKAEPSYEFND